MAHRAIIQLLIDVDSEAEACDAVSETMREQTRAFTPHSCILDWRYVPPAFLPPVDVGPVAADFDPDSDWPGDTDSLPDYSPIAPDFYKDGARLQFTYPNFAVSGIEGEGMADYAAHSGQIVTVLWEAPRAFTDGDGNACRGYRVQADDGWTGLVWPGELRPPSANKRCTCDAGGSAGCPTHDAAVTAAPAAADSKCSPATADSGAVSLPSFDNTRAEREGWGIFHSSDHGFEIEKLDSPELDNVNPIHTFATDTEALLYVRFRAARGSDYHNTALNFITEHNPTRYPDEPGVEIGAPMDHEQP